MAQTCEICQKTSYSLRDTKIEPPELENPKPLEVENPKAL